MLQPADLDLDQRDALLAEQLFLLGQHNTVALEFGVVSVELDAQKEDVGSPVSRVLAGRYASARTYVEYDIRFMPSFQEGYGGGCFRSDPRSTLWV